MNSRDNKLRYRNPFREATSSELIDNPDVYSKLFSQEILVNETLDVFEKSNIVLTGPQGTGKTMILSLFQHSFLSACLQSDETARVLAGVRPYLSISINLVRSGFHVFGRRAVGKACPNGTGNAEDLNAQGASDVLCHTLFHQLLVYLTYLASEEGTSLRQWIGISPKGINETQIARTISKWPCWRGYYSRFSTLTGLIERCRQRLNSWHDFLNVNTDFVDDEVWKSTPPLEEVLHCMGQLAASLCKSSRKLPLYVVIDQYEVLPELNKVYGSSLQRIVNSLIKARDPYVFYKIGARPYDWGKELRVWGSESRIEVDRDYKIVNLTDVLRRRENKNGWLFPVFAADVASRRLRELGGEFASDSRYIEKFFGAWSENVEASLYSKKKSRNKVVLRNTPEPIIAEIQRRCGVDASCLDLRLASAWTQQRLQHGLSTEEVAAEMGAEPVPWERSSWRKERIEVALLQIASMTNQRKLYFGWNTVLFLSGSDIRAFLRICEEVWELAAKVAPERLVDGLPVSREIQSEGIFEASHRWRVRDRTETHGGGSHRYSVLGRLGPAIHDYLMKDLAISNPGHTGFSLRQPDLSVAAARSVIDFLGSGVNWAIFEERLHTSKNGGATRSKWFLHPILSPAFGIPLKRVKEPYYTTLEEVHQWLSDGTIRFGTKKRTAEPVAKRRTEVQRELRFGESDETTVGPT